ncbi:MAG TPA: SDR family oxidoreductase [Polyangiaceae bacterium]|nr:SDR family oxidoreductase [Polyangiaceae bacterium]
MSTSGRLQEKVALITGGASGLGLATARLFIAEGARVFITGRRQEALDAAVRELGPQATGVQGDQAKLEDIDRVFASIRTQAGRLDVLFANAGGGSFAALEQVTEAHFDRHFDINVKGTVFTVQKALPLLGPGSSIVLNSSMVSVRGLPTFGVYAATKAALRSFARTWAAELKGRQIRVNVISPGTVITAGYKSELGFTDEQLVEVEAQTAATTPLGRSGTPAEVASAVLFLASAESSYVNGVDLFVDGGAGQI